jgi:hypothetical protein
MVLVLVAVLTLLGVLWFTLTWGPAAEPVTMSANQGENLLPMTGTTARLRGENYLRTVVSYAQTIYAVDQDQDRPGAVILIRDDDLATALTTTRLQHFPVNAPLLYVTDNGSTLPEATRDELRRLDPEGVMMDNNVQVYLVGDISPAIAREVQAMRFRTRQIFAQNAIQLSRQLDEYLAVLEANHSEVVLIAATDAPEYALSGANWNAHMGQAFAFVAPEGVPRETRQMLERRWPNYPYIYVFAPQTIVNDEVMAELAQYGHVQRIPGDSPQEMAVRWAGYKDFGRGTAWWFGESDRQAGWGLAEPGHNIILANPVDWRTVVTTGVLSHMGKHAFLVLTNEDGSLPDPVVSYLNIIKPTRTHPSQQVFNFGWIVGDGIPDATVQQVSDLLSVAHPISQ